MPEADPLLQIFLSEFDDVREGELEFGSRAPLDEIADAVAGLLDLGHRHGHPVTHEEGVGIRVDDDPLAQLRLPDFGNEMSRHAIDSLGEDGATGGDAHGLSGH